ncbi:ArsR/SmtB family transcription factor [Streptomyces djakartensis]|uniref:Transcriptional regulator n=1 Tax=Streptomyces djakartensis TaxID=68193 RepID=A0ABQ2Z294_9ACTN|nr:helix-turn-helix domain-containing protein [Streptomyces djakartensis]GGY02657.1 transcriptional regulator [Streptomyces djakartensis]
MVRIHFTSADLTRVRIAVPGPLAETQLSLRTAQHSGEAAFFGSWRSRVRPRLFAGDLSALIRGLAPVEKGLVDLFTLAGTAPDMEGALDALLTDPRPLREELALYSLGRLRMLPRWVLAASAGDHAAARHLARALSAAHGATVAPHWERVHAVLLDERSAAMRVMADGGVGALFSSLHPAIRWSPPTLEVDYRPWANDADVHMEGSGMVITPSVFCRSPLLFAAKSGGLMLIYPVLRDVLAAARVFASPEPNKVVADLLGRTRAAVLEATVGEPTTGQIARALGISPASASQHAAVLRQAGLVTSRRHGKAVHHMTTPLGKALLNGYR